MEKELKYEAAFAELQAIVHKMENDELDIDQMAEQLKRAQELIKLCKDKLTKTDSFVPKTVISSLLSAFLLHIYYLMCTFATRIETLTVLKRYEEFRLG